MVEIRPAYADLAAIRALFEEYAAALGIDLNFQMYAEELRALPGKYAPPEGRLYIAYVDGKAAGGVAMRRLDEARCEMKRLYVRPAHRGLGLGRLLIERLIQDAATLSYRYMVLDTLTTMAGAIGLYRKMGFKEIPPYYDNPHSAIFFRLDLENPDGK